jgi:hypothetical protein
MTQSIIVYRNPVEQAIWEGLTSSDLTFLIFVAASVFFVVTMIVSRLLNSRTVLKALPFLPRTYGPIDTYLPIAMGAVASALTLWAML